MPIISEFDAPKPNQKQGGDLFRIVVRIKDPELLLQAIQQMPGVELVDSFWEEV